MKLLETATSALRAPMTCDDTKKKMYGDEIYITNLIAWRSFSF